MDYSKLDGYQFEDYIETILKKMGLNVINVGYSNDGGVDLIASCDTPIFKGKYIIQCKNWKEKVGQPVVRDLYGVIMDSRANKGILIATGAFTEQAYEFAEGKNIELIDRVGLQRLEEICSSGEYKENNEYFLSNEAFDSDKYKYIIKKIESDPGVKTYYDYALDFLGEYIFSMKYLGTMDGVVEEYQRLCDEMIKRVYNRKRKSDLCEKNLVLMKKCFTSIIAGHIDNSVELLFDIGREWFAPDYDYYKKHYRNLKSLIHHEFGSDLYISTDQSYSIFKVFHHLFISMKYEEATRFIERFFCLEENDKGIDIDIQLYGSQYTMKINNDELRELANCDPNRLSIPRNVSYINSSKYNYNIFGFDGVYVMNTKKIIESWNRDLNQIKKDVQKIINIHSEI